MSIILYIAVMAGVTYLVRMIPFTLFRRQIKSRYIRSVLYYLPYAVLSAMTIPAIFYSTGNFITAAVGQVCTLHGVPFLVLRALSDDANGHSPDDFPAYCAKVSKTSSRAIEAFMYSLA